MNESYPPLYFLIFHHMSFLYQHLQLSALDNAKESKLEHSNIPITFVVLLINLDNVLPSSPENTTLQQ